MADTIVRYLETEVSRREVARRALLSGSREIEFAASKVTALRLSSSLIKVNYRAATPTESERISEALQETADRYVAGLNEQAADRNWFTIVSSDALSHDGRINLPNALAGSFLIGLLVAFWTVLGLWYWKENRRSVDV